MHIPKLIPCSTVQTVPDFVSIYSTYKNKKTSEDLFSPLLPKRLTPKNPGYQTQDLYSEWDPDILHVIH